MKAVKVTYTVKPEYVSTNQQNIKAVMDYLEANPIEGMDYNAYLLEDGQSFMHINVAKDEATMNQLLSVDAFNAFRMALKASEPVSPPKSEVLDKI
ncbi:hypothetical protein HOH87_07490 [bacterium]|jgi:hypothetical protein|nr:hypothetical protein [bacterium]